MSAAGPRVSVLLPVRDAASYLDQAVDSLRAQTFRDFEVVVVDDGSSDDTPAMLAAWACRDTRLRVLRQDRAGIVAALERGRAASRASLLARMDADDIALPERLERQVALMDARADLDVVGCGVRYFPEEAVQDGARRYQRWLNAVATHQDVIRDLFVECPLAHPTLMMRASALERAGGYVDRGWPEDYDVVLRLWAAGARFGKVPDILHLWRERPDRLSRTDPRYADDAFRRCKAHYLGARVLRGRRAVVWGAGPVGKAFSRALEHAGSGVEAFVEVDARKIGQEIHGVPVLDTAAGLARTEAFHLLAVGQPGARRALRIILTEGGLQEVRDFLAVA